MEVGIMPKDSQPDKKKVKLKKTNGQAPSTKGHKTQSNNTKRQSTKPNDV